MTYCRSHGPILFGTLVATLCLLALASSANATLVTVADGVVTLEGSAEQTKDGQKFTFNFGPFVAPSDGNDATFEIRARGDYTPGNDSEFLTWNIEGVASGTASPDTGKVSDKSWLHNVEWRDTFTISGEDLAAITSDYKVKIVVDLSPDVELQQPYFDEWVQVKMTYVPEPATLLLLGTGSLLLLRPRKRKA